MMPSGRSSFGHAQKHRNHLTLLERMMEDEASAEDSRGVDLWPMPSMCSGRIRR